MEWPSGRSGTAWSSPTLQGMTTLRITRSKVRLALALALVPAALFVNRATAAQPQSRPPAEPTVVRTAAGLLRGGAEGGARVFNGIPYAAPPVGALRWKAPQAVKPWHGVRDALKLASACAQQDNPEIPGGSTAEDCLYLNVTTPAQQAERPRAVVVWIPGGG
ncbi:MAG: para-nitrobenzyl esterase, partial [Kribbellaceae bacterium]|nr:para-nitrobenzyl esterase [Kribbellaceae bacterium]